MRMSSDEARRLLREHGLRVTSPRLAVLELLSQVHKPLSYMDVLHRLGHTDWDPATIYRNLVKLRDAGLAPVVSRAGGCDRYALAGAQEAAHRHPHFVCDDCGEISCLPMELAASITMEGPWAQSIAHATVQLRGECPSCIAAAAAGQP